MQNLYAFQNPWPQIAVRSELENQGNLLKLKFELKDSLNNIKTNPSFFQNVPTESQRKDGLWKSTCFELFLKTPEKSSYYEFNFSPDGFWNIYEFSDYRKPQPPIRSEAFQIQEWSWRQNNLSVLIINKTSQMNWLVSMTAVLQNLNNEIQYWALKHSDEKPNFHHFESFVQLKKGASL